VGLTFLTLRYLFEIIPGPATSQVLDFLTSWREILGKQLLLLKTPAFIGNKIFGIQSLFHLVKRWA
jgi:hypothetical protein